MARNIAIATLVVLFIVGALYAATAAVERYRANAAEVVTQAGRV